MRHRGRADYCQASATERCPTALSARRCRFHSSSRKAGSNHNANLDLIDTPQRNRQLADIKRTESEGKQYIGHQLQTVKRRSAYIGNDAIHLSVSIVLLWYGILN